MSARIGDSSRLCQRISQISHLRYNWQIISPAASRGDESRASEIKDHNLTHHAIQAIELCV
jgi:hypothetical protein